MGQIGGRKEATDLTWRLPKNVPEASRHGWGVCVKLANLPSKNTHHKQIDRPDQWCANDNIVAGTGNQAVIT